MLEGQLRSQNLPSAILYDILKHGKVERAHFHAFSSHFLKENLSEGVPVQAFWAFLVPKVYLGVKTMCKKFQKVGPISCDLAQ